MTEPFTVDHFGKWASKLVLDNGKKWILEPYQEAFLADFFAGTPECWLIIPEGNGKSTTVSGIALYHAQHKPDAWVPIAAASRDQAQIMYRQAKGFVLRSPSISGNFRPYDGYRRIVYLPDSSQIEVFSADERTGDGIIPTLCILDELHRHKNLALYETWRGKIEKRVGQIITISTAGEPGGEFEETRERIRQMADDVHRDGAFVRAASRRVVLHEYAVPEGGDVEDLDLVKAANPFSGVTVDVLRRKFESPTMTIGHWRRFTCNLPTRSAYAAIQEAEWDAARTGEEIPVGQPVAAGLDVAWKWDTTALVPLWMRDPGYRLLGPATVLVPPRDGTSLDPNLVERALIELHERNPLHTVVMDTSRAEQLAEWIASELGATVIDRTQSNKLAADDYSRFMEALRSGWLRHTGDRALRRHALNAVARVLPQGDARFDRPSSTRQGGDQDRRVIDALIAAAMVHSIAASRRSSVYRDRGMVTL